MPTDIAPRADAEPDPAAAAGADARAAIRALTYADEAGLVRELVAGTRLDPAARAEIAAAATRLVEQVRERSSPTVMEAFLAEYGLSTDEGVGLMCLAEALLRVPDAQTIDELIADKIEPSNWGAHLGRSTSSLVNAATWGLMLTGRVLDDSPGPAALLRSAMRRLGEPVVRNAVGQAMKLMGRQFVLGETIGAAMDRARTLEARGYSYSYDMLGEAARTEADAERYAAAYADAIAAIAARATGDVRSSPGISVKLSALHPRYEWSHRASVMAELVPRALALARAAARARIGFNIDAEEAERLDLSLDVIEALFSDPLLDDWQGFGVVVQAYGRRAGAVIDRLAALAEARDRRMMVRLVKGAYWDSEVKGAQEKGLPGFPVFTRKPSTDVSYIANARKLLDARGWLYPQFATHNAHTVAAVLAMAGGDRDGFEFQRLHGMGEALHEIVRAGEGTRCRIYAPVGAHRDLLAYLVRRLLENGANSSFVNQIVDKSLPASAIAADPIAEVEGWGGAVANPGIAPPAALYAPRENAAGWNVNEPASVAGLIAAREAWRAHRWTAGPCLPRPAPGAAPRPVVNPADPEEVVGEVREATIAEVAAALAAARDGFPGWAATPAAERAACLRRAADLYEANAAELTALATREAGKTLADSIAELREAVDFLRYYADAAEAAGGEGRGVIVAISPWNFPLAIFTGQVAACLGAGNVVVAKPAEQTPLIAARAVALLHEAGVPRDALLLLPGDGPGVGAPLTAAPGIAGVVFTGSTEVAQAIHRALAANAAPDAVLVAETGGLNAMVVDSTALTEQVVRDVLASAFQSAGQRCSALRLLYVQEEAKGRVMEMLEGAMETLRLGDPWDPATDVGPVIDGEAEAGISAYVEARGDRVVKALAAPGPGRFVAPAVIEVGGIADLEREVFGPVLHVAPFRADGLDAVVDAINARGYGLTFGLHSRIDDRVERVTARLAVGNMYVNRNQIGAIVGSQPFGGEGLSGTGPKAGGPFYLPRLQRRAEAAAEVGPGGPDVEVAGLFERLDAAGWAARGDRIAALRRLAGGEAALEAAARLPQGPVDLPGPTGESNRLSLHPRGRALCLGAGAAAARAQAVQALAAGNAVVVVAEGAVAALAPFVAAGLPVVARDGRVAPGALTGIAGLGLVAARGPEGWLRELRGALAARPGAIVALETALIAPERYVVERHLCIDTTAAGGNASLLAESA
ncbi:bifunctional proline dehydrogenase/L-glutamate gamma-semialdehyde dehydrogenase PutA [Amaricoccus sp.]|uniref:bifunctional proline dehydrogenase/L-glutamate gamma-semialdehyde dehydrogenase PutA n=1 Tax=Amaricoccus sp. TaxID=1872485 RepID=UPI001B4286FD|nr:bifunctional proline dehydrogenase/L-glutamate gamma-semialdehyde dehydrogenase PutA [Amaricoccus sp.]MBP7003237.1 bifunctional proline dehydrogenase/L-glutamate gamma-semialdehyde dehydrogenase PutA [Amaricoccus sp.]